MLIVHRAAGGAALARALADVLATPLGDPFASEVVAVPAQGVERWLAQRLSHVLGAHNGDGVCANVVFPSPASMLDDALQSVSAEHAETVERWAAKRSVWPLVDVIDASLPSEAWCRPLAQHLGSGADDKGRRMAVAGRLARLFEDYGQSRPDMLRAWAAGRDEVGDGQPLADDLRWQAELWRRLRDSLGTPSPAEQLADACARLREEPGLSQLPGRLSVFGASRLSPARLTVLAALAAHRDVHVWLHHASPVLWEKVQQSKPVLRRRDDETAGVLTNPLLTSLSRDILELQQLVARCAPESTTVLHESEPQQDTLLGWLKQDLADDAISQLARPLDENDRSVQVHATHGRTRQVEVLREVIVGLLADDPTLEPRDIVVMCPDVETFAPIVAATFSLGAEEDAAHPAARLRVRLADRALRQTNGLLSVLAQLLELGAARITASQVLDLAATPAVRLRFRFDDDELERLRDWTVGTGVRWGLDSAHRSTWGLGAVAQGTWRAGLDKLLLGAAMEGTLAAYGDVVPLDDIDSSDIDLAGRFAELVDRLAAAQSLMAERHSPEGWMSGLEAAVLGLATTTRDTAWQHIQLRGELADITEAATGSPAQLGLSDVRSLLDSVLAGRPTRSSFRTGTLTVCTLVPMRSVPHRVVCLLGLDDGVFPRQSIRDGDDVLARDPWVGERDPRSEDRQLLLDAISAAEERLVITYTGSDERTGADVPPAVPLGELLDALDRTATASDRRRVRDVVTVRHPLQPFDARNFQRGSIRPAAPFSFDQLAFAGAVAAVGPGTEPGPFLAGPLPARPPGPIQLIDLHRLIAHPARGFLRQRLQVAETRGEDEPADSLPVELDSLEQWAVGERVLSERLAGLEPAACRSLEEARGTLPPGKLGAASLLRVGRSVEALVQATLLDRAVEPTGQDVDINLPDGTRLTGTVDGVRGDVIFSITYSRLAPRHRLRAWVDLVALSVAQPGRAWRAVAVGRDGRGTQRSVFEPLSLAEARSALVELVDLYRAGLNSPLPLPIKTAEAYATARKTTRVPAARVRAEQEWEGGRFPGDRGDAEYVLMHGPEAPFTVLTSQPPQPGEGGPGWPTDETDRFGLLARRLWDRLQAAEASVKP